ncbi:MAG: stalk domain-containing protein [Bacillota bacterium]|jgi:hypothetical protein
MKKRLLLLLALLLILVWAVPVSAAGQLSFNGRTYDTAAELNIQEGITSVPIDVLVRTLGCSLSVEGDNITLQENDSTLKMTIGSTTAFFNGQEKKMPKAPQRINSRIHVPMRFIYECFGATVTWKDTQRKILVLYAETRKGMTAEELLTQSSKKMQEANRYKMTMDSDADIDMIYQEQGKSPENVKMQMVSSSECWIQIDPMLMYMKQNMDIKVPEGAEANNEPQNVQMEMLFQDNKMYMTLPEIGWVKMDLSGINIEELMKQSNSQDPATVMEQMKEMGMAVSLGNDREKNGQKYWVINVTMGSDVLNSDYFKQLTQNLKIPEAAETQKMFENMNLDIVYSAWINPQTFYTDFIDFESKMVIKDIKNPDTKKPGPVTMEMDMTSTYTISDYGSTFQVPDVSKAVDYQTVAEPKE